MSKLGDVRGSEVKKRDDGGRVESKFLRTQTVELKALRIWRWVVRAEAKVFF